MTDIDLAAAKNAAREALETNTTWSPMHYVDVIVDAALPHILAQVEARVKPSREDAARALSVTDVHHPDLCDCGDFDAAQWCDGLEQQIDAVLALLPGRTEAEVRGEALQEVAEQFFIPSQGLGHYLAVDFAETLGKEFLRGYAERIARGGEQT